MGRNPPDSAADPWSGKNSHAAGQLSPCAAAAEPELESPYAAARGSQRSRFRGEPGTAMERAPLTPTGAAPSKAAEAPHGQVNTFFFFFFAKKH